MARKRVANGVTFQETPSHGYYYLSSNRMEAMPEKWRKSGYEEDCEWALIALIHPDVWPDHMDEAHELVKNYWPDEYREYIGEFDPQESRLLRKRVFCEANKDKYIVVAAAGSWHKDVPEGWVGAYTVRGGRNPDGGYASDDHAKFLVPSEAYGNRGSEFGYVIDEKCKPWKGDI